VVTFEPMLGAVQALVDSKRVPGVVLRVCRYGEIEVEGVFGDQQPALSTPMRVDSIFRIYSMTKPITSVAVMMLVEAGDISLDEPITRTFPEFAHLEVGIEAQDEQGALVLKREPAGRSASIRDLMRHTAGFTYGNFNDSLVKAEYRSLDVDSQSISSNELISRLAAAPLAFRPGTTWEYSRATDILGVLVERISGQTLGEFFEQRIFAPLGMVDTAFVVPEAKLGRVAEAFALDPDTQEPIYLRNPAKLAGYCSGGGGLFSTLSDYQCFIELLRGRGATKGVRLVSSSSIAAMTRDHLGSIARGPDYLPGPDCGFGLGFAVRMKDGPLGHRGDFNWYGMGGTIFWIDPSMDLTATWLMQAPNQRAETNELFRRLVTDAYRG
jgi:CubicO group peptidase (beta-lactamase class C family)